MIANVRDTGSAGAGEASELGSTTDHLHRASLFSTKLHFALTVCQQRR